MGKGKTRVWIVKYIKPDEGAISTRLIRGTLREVEAKLRQETSIEPCEAEDAHKMADVEIEEAGE